MWALGAILYECLTGCRPFGGGDTWAVIDRIGHADPPGVRRGCPGCPRDLEAVVLKCLAKAPHHRYPTAAELAADLDRFLAGEAVTARPPSVRDRVGKWVRRHPAATVAVALGAVLVAGLAASTALLTTAYGNERAARDDAESREREAVAAKSVADDERQRADGFRAEADQRRNDAEASLAEALRRKTEAESVIDLLVGLFGASDPIGFLIGGGDPSALLGPEATARELLRVGLTKLRARTDLPPSTRATLLTTLGGVFRSLGELGTARECLTEALSIRRQLHPLEHPDVATTLSELGLLALFEGECAEAWSIQRDVLAMRRRLLPDHHPHITASLMNFVTATMLNPDEAFQGRGAESSPLLKEVISRQERWPNGGHGDPVISRLVLAALYYGLGYKELVKEADGLVAGAFYLAATQPEKWGWVLEVAGLVTAAQGEFRSGNFAGMEANLVRAVTLLKERYGIHHPLVAAALISVAEARLRGGRLGDAMEAYDEVLRILYRLLPDGHYAVAQLRTEAGMALLNLADKTAPAEHQKYALRELREGMEVAARIGRTDLFIKARDHCASLLRNMGRPNEADELLRRPGPIPRPRPRR